MAVPEILVSEVVLGMMVIPELQGSENNVKMPEPFGVVASWAMPWFSYCGQEGQAGSPTPLLSSPSTLDPLPTPPPRRPLQVRDEGAGLQPHAGHALCSGGDQQRQQPAARRAAGLRDGGLLLHVQQRPAGALLPVPG